MGTRGATATSKQQIARDFQSLHLNVLGFERAEALVDQLPDDLVVLHAVWCLSQSDRKSEQE
jgi:hypothetical protein